MTTAYLLMGLPGSGKTTFRESLPGVFYTASSDDFIQAWADLHNKTYNEVFREQVDAAQKHFDTILGCAISDNRDVVIDRTNLDKKSRQKILSRLPFEWKKIGVLVRCSDFELWKTRLMSRPGKTIPAEVIKSMMNRFEHPTTDEGFNMIFEVLT